MPETRLPVLFACALGLAAAQSAHADCSAIERALARVTAEVRGGAIDPFPSGSGRCAQLLAP